MGFKLLGWAWRRRLKKIKVRGLGCKQKSSVSISKQVASLASDLEKSKIRDRKRKSWLLRSQIGVRKKRTLSDSESDGDGSLALSNGSSKNWVARDRGGDSSSSSSSGSRQQAKKRLASQVLCGFEGGIGSGDSSRCETSG